MALHINMASTDPFFIFRSSTGQLSHLSLFHIMSFRALVKWLFEIKSFFLKLFWRKIIIFWYTNSISDFFSEKKIFKATFYTESYCIYRGTCMYKTSCILIKSKVINYFNSEFVPQRVTFNSKPSFSRETTFFTSKMLFKNGIFWLNFSSFLWFLYFLNKNKAPDKTASTGVRTQTYL